MRITLLAVGSRGDVQPYIALGRQLQVAGHDVCLASHAVFAPLVEAHYLRFHELAGDPRMLAQTELGAVHGRFRSEPRSLSSYAASGRGHRICAKS